MHRQSLGSPASKLQCHGVVFSGTGVNNEDNGNGFTSEAHRKDKLPSCSAGATDDEEHKSQKSNQQKSVPVSSSSSKLVHLIPVVMFFCFLILYISSHDPSNKDLAQTQFNGFATLSSKKIGIDDNVGGGSVEIEKNDVLAIRSSRNLQQRERHRFNRKFWQ